MFASIQQSTELLTGILRPTCVARSIGVAAGLFRSISYARASTRPHQPIRRWGSIYVKSNKLFYSQTRYEKWGGSLFENVDKIQKTRLETVKNKNQDRSYPPTASGR